MISRFPKDWKILYVEPSFWLSLAWSIFHKIPFKRSYMAQENVEVTSIMTIPFGDRFGFTRRCNDRIIVGKMKKILKERNVTNPILLFYKPRYSCVIGSMDEGAVCYDITDDVREFDASAKWLEEYIETLESKSDIMFTSSERILKKLQSDKKNAFLIGNGVEATHFEKASFEETKIADEMRDIPSPVIGYTGAVGEWFDFELLQSILQRFPDASVVLIGWTFSNQKKILKQIKSKNLYFLGVKQYQKLPRYMKAFDVCIIPFRLSKLTQSVNPNKFYEYLASGKPIITTNLPEIGKFSDLCMVARNHEEFLEHIKAALEGNYSGKESLETARQNDWKYKAARMVELLGKLKTK